MKKIRALAHALALSGWLAAPAAHAAMPGLTESVVVVDKKANQIQLCNYNDGRLDIVKTYRATFGKSVGDKLWEGDLKTPEGIYDLPFFKKAPQLGKKFGPLAIYIGYPNSMDKHGAKTGDQIMLHGTDDPARLERQFDSLGCVVTDNVNVKEIADEIKPGQTKIVITRSWETLKDFSRLPKAKKFLQDWLNAWSSKDLGGYIESYADEYIPQKAGRNRNEFAHYKDSLNKKYGTIKVTASNVRYYFHEKYDLITFTQDYSSTFPNGKPAYSGTSRKNLFIQERNGNYRIVTEENQQ
ncbi:MAG: L,D-transpeptidase family protein [Bdellovibrionota bacterium]